MTTDITGLATVLRLAAESEIAYRAEGDTSDLWQDEVSPDNILALVETLEKVQDCGKVFQQSFFRQSLMYDVVAEAYEEAKEQIAKDVEIKARLCRESNSLFDRLRLAEKRIAELEAQNTVASLPGGFSIEESRSLQADLVRSHISKALSGEKMKSADKNADLQWIHSVIVRAAWFVKASVEATAGIKVEAE